MAGYLANVTGLVPLVLDLRNTHDRWGSISDPIINGPLHFPNDVEGHLMRLLLTELENITLIIITIPLTLSPLELLFLVRLGGYTEFVRLLFLQAHRETDRFFTNSGVQIAQHHRDQFHYHRTVVSSQLKSKVGNILAKPEALRITVNIDVAPVVSRSHTHPSHSQTSRLLTSSLSLGVPVPLITQCM